jgi:hypothetical protein
LLQRLILALINVLPAAPLAALLVLFPRRQLARRDAHCIVSYFTPRRLARRAARCIACFIPSWTAFPPRFSLDRLVVSYADRLPAARLTALHVYFPRRRPARPAAR